MRKAKILKQGRKMIRVWFNHWFSTSYGIIELMKKDKNEEIYVIGSNSQKNSVIKKVCHEWYEDSEACGNEYVDFALNFCREHKVDVFVPRRNMTEISRCRSNFEKIGVKLLLDDYEKIEYLNDKAKTYRLLQKIPSLFIPDFEVVNTYDQFQAAYKRLQEKHGQICVKFVKDEGARSYRRIIGEKENADSIKTYAGSSLSFEKYSLALKELGTFDDLMVMEYLPGNEISVDCLSTKKALIAVPRFKGNGRDEKIFADEEILKMSRDIMDEIQLEYPCNIQFRLKDGKPYLLEINTRMSGGLQMSCLAEDINIPNIALNKVLGKEVDWNLEIKERVVSYIETPVILA